MGREEEVAVIAYDLWQQAGCPDGCALDHWLLAEAAWTERQPSPGNSTEAAPDGAAPPAGLEHGGSGKSSA